jgi:O-antigen ligase
MQTPTNVRETASISRGAEASCGFLLAAAFTVIQTLIGGTRLLFSLPAYALLGLIGLLTVLSIRRAKPHPNQICLVSSVAFFSYILGRAVLSPVEYLARPDIYSVLGCLLVYFFVACTFTGAKQRTWFLFFLLTLAVVQVCIGAIQFRNGDNFMLIPFLQRFDYGRRASGFYVCPNHLAGLLEVLGVFGLSIACWGRWPVWARLLTLYAVGVCYLGIVLTASRAGYFSSAVSLLVFFTLSLLVLWRASIKLFVKIGGVGLVAAAALGLTAIFLTQQSFFLSERAQEVVEHTDNMRVDLWKAALQQWSLQPLFGTGSGTYLYYGRQFRTERVTADPVEVHNDYLHLLAEYGIVGAAGFVIFIGSHLRNGWKSFQRLGPKRVAVSTRLLSNSMALQIGALAAVAAYVVHSAFDFNLHIPANALLLAFVFGLLANAGIQRENGAPRPTKSQMLSRLVLPIIGLAVLIQCVRLLPGEYFAERARTALRDNDPMASASFALRALASEQKNPDLYYYLGRAGILEGNWNADLQKRAFLFQVAMAAFGKGWALTPQDETFPVELASLYDALARFPEAEWMYYELYRLDPKFLPFKQSYEAHLQKWQASGDASRQYGTAEPAPQ